MRTITYETAIFEAIAEEMRNDDRIFHLSTDAPEPLVTEFGDNRVRSTPIAESALTGMAVGAAGSGYRPIIDWRSITFAFVAMDQVVNQVSKIHYMYGGQRSFPIVFRTKVGGGTRRAAQHSQSPYSMFMNIAGLKLLLPSTPYDVKGLLKSQLLLVHETAAGDVTAATGIQMPAALDELYAAAEQVSDLGAHPSPSGTGFAVWAPRSLTCSAAA